MMDAEQIRFIREEIKKQLNIVLNAETGPNDSQTETINSLFPGMPGIISRPVMHPFGFVSRAVQGTISVVVKVGADIQNRMTIGHRDKGRPTDLEEGESILYSVGDYRIKVKKSMVQVGKGTTYEVTVMGETLEQFLSQLTDLISKHTHAAPGAPPTEAAQFIQLKTNFLDNDKILAKDGGAF